MCLNLRLIIQKLRGLPIKQEADQRLEAATPTCHSPASIPIHCRAQDDAITDAQADPPNDQQATAVAANTGDLPGIGNEDPQDDNQSRSSGSSRPNSTSTNQYSHEPYESYQHKAKSLVDEIGGEDVQLLNRIRGGSSNRVIAVKLTPKQKPASPMAAILRIPRFPDLKHNDSLSESVDTGILDQIATSQFISTYTIPIPTVLAFDSTISNRIGSPYVLYELAKGTSLDNLYGKLTYAERRAVVHQIISVLVELDGIEFPTSGRLQLRENCLGTKAPLSFGVSPCDELRGRLRVTGLGTSPDGTAYPTKPMETLYGMLKTQLVAQLMQSRGNADNPKNKLPAMIEKLQSVLQDMHDMSFFSTTNPTRNVLYHGDFEPRNLLFSPGDTVTSKKPELSAVLDWDDALVLPDILTRRPLTWIWDFSEVFPDDGGSIPSDYDSDYDLFDPHRYDESKGRLSREDQAMRTYFERNFVKQMSKRIPGYNMKIYQDEAYGKGYWLRRLARFAIHGITSSCDVHRFKRFAREWDEFKTK